MTQSKSLLDVPHSSTPSILKLQNHEIQTSAKREKPAITKPNASADLKAKLSSFLPDLKAANDALPQDTSKVDIEHLEDDSQYIEMDLGLGVLEEQHSGDSSSSDDDQDGRDVMSKLLHKTPLQSSAITVVDEPKPVTDAYTLSCDTKLQHYRDQALPEMRTEMEIVLSLMSRILAQLRRHQDTQVVDTITKLNVLREDMYKLMSRRDRLIETDDGRLKHETAYLDELDELLS